MEEFFKQYRKMQQTLADIHQAESLLEGDEWALRNIGKEDDYQSFWIDHVDEDDALIYQTWDGGGHCKQNSIDMKEFTKKLNQTPKDRLVWLDGCAETCKDIITKKKEDYLCNRLSSGLALIKWSILENNKEGAQEAFDELIKDKLG